MKKNIHVKGRHTVLKAKITVYAEDQGEKRTFHIQGAKMTSDLLDYRIGDMLC